MMGNSDRIHITFLLITPQSVARIQPRFLADIVGLVDSEYMTDRTASSRLPSRRKLSRLSATVFKWYWTD